MQDLAVNSSAQIHAGLDVAVFSHFNINWLQNRSLPSRRKMSSHKLLGLPPISPELKAIVPFLQRAEELKKQEPVVAYWCKSIAH